MDEHWREFGRNYYSRFDYEAVPIAEANQVMDALRASLGTLKGQSFAGLKVVAADEFSYLDPVDGSSSDAQGLRVWFEDDNRAVLRLSGTGTEGATIRLYLEHLATSPDGAWIDAQAALTPLLAGILELTQLQVITGRDGPDVKT